MGQLASVLKHNQQKNDTSDGLEALSPAQAESYMSVG